MKLNNNKISRVYNIIKLEENEYKFLKFLYLS